MYSLMLLGNKILILFSHVYLEVYFFLKLNYFGGASMKELFIYFLTVSTEVF